MKYKIALEGFDKDGKVTGWMPANEDGRDTILVDKEQIGKLLGDMFKCFPESVWV